MQQVGTWLSLVERTLGVGEVASSNLVVPTIFLPAFKLRSLRPTGTQPFCACRAHSNIHGGS